MNTGQFREIWAYRGGLKAGRERQELSQETKNMWTNFPWNN